MNAIVLSTINHRNVSPICSSDSFISVVKLVPSLWDQEESDMTCVQNLKIILQSLMNDQFYQLIPIIIIIISYNYDEIMMKLITDMIMAMMKHIRLFTISYRVLTCRETLFPLWSAPIAALQSLKSRWYHHVPCGEIMSNPLKTP